MNLATTSK